MDHHHRLDRVRPVRRECRLDDVRGRTAAPVPWDELDLEAQARRHLSPQRRKLAGLGHEHPVARRERVDDGGFPRAGSGGGIDHHRACGPEDRPAAVHYLASQPSELRAAMVDHLPVHGLAHALGHWARPRDLQEMLSGSGHRSSPFGRRASMHSSRETGRRNCIHFLRRASLAPPIVASCECGDAWIRRQLRSGLNRSRRLVRRRCALHAGLLVKLLPNRGARLRTPGEHDVSELLDVVGGLEALAGRPA